MTLHRPYLASPGNAASLSREVCISSAMADLWARLTAYPLSGLQNLSSGSYRVSISIVVLGYVLCPSLRALDADELLILQSRLTPFALSRTRTRDQRLSCRLCGHAPRSIGSFFTRRRSLTRHCDARAHPTQGGHPGGSSCSSGNCTQSWRWGFWRLALVASLGIDERGTNERSAALRYSHSTSKRMVRHDWTRTSRPAQLRWYAFRWAS